MKQLVLDLRPDRPPMLENFVAGDNAELLAHLSRLAARAPDASGAHLYLWGAHGSGRSHLLHAAVARARENGRAAYCLAAAEVGANLPDEADALVAIDDAERLDAAAQIALFNAFNRARRNEQTLLISGPVAPRELALREDLRTRIGQCLIFETRPLDDDTRAAILRVLAERSGLRLSDEIVAFLLHHGQRDLPSMAAAVAALDGASLEHKRPLTLPLLRQLMREGLKL
ncbi:MAG: DnaA regulatory inactivator Hda [Azoarcus sp.]|jgi:DnaA family protein|nr:DnaA regulatory inactivator Hda [Azoarcus sp.]